MIERIYLALVLIFFILAFAVRNFKTYLATKQSIKGKSAKLTLSIFLSSVIYALILLRLGGLHSRWFFELSGSGYFIVKVIGFIFVSIGFIVGLMALKAMKNSWRVGIKYNQKTNLVTSGIYRFSRNPYFFSYDMLILGYLILFPSILLLVFYFSLVIVFHRMILEEEKYLQSVHGGSYADYKRKVSRYITFN